MTRLGRAALLVDVGIVLGFVLARALMDARGRGEGPMGPPGPMGPMGIQGPPGLPGWVNPPSPDLPPFTFNASKENDR